MFNTSYCGKQLIIDLILFEGQHGVVSEIARSAKQYLATNKQLAQAVFNTIVKLAEDEMNHQKFNAEYYKKHRKKERFKFLPNTQPKLKGVEYYIENDGREKYQSKKEQIVNEFLFNSVKLDLSRFDMDDYNISTMCYAINCGLSLNDTAFAGVVKEIVMSMIDIWKINERTHNSHEILDVYSRYEVSEFFQKELLGSEKQTSTVLDILFTDINFSKFTREAVEFYLDVFGSLLAEYFDSYSDKARRAKCEKIIHSLEDKVLTIKEKYVKVELYKSLILTITGYGGSGDWSNLPSGYSYQDKQFLNTMFSAYGGFHLSEMLNTIHKLKIGELLPEVLLSLRDAIKYALEKETSAFGFSKKNMDNKVLVLMIISKAFLDFSDQIKQDNELTKALEEILEMLVEINCEEAATILDEFRIH